MAPKKAGKATSAKKSRTAKATAAPTAATTGSVSASRSRGIREARATSPPRINTAVTNRQRTRARIAVDNNISPVLNVAWGAHPDNTSRQANTGGANTSRGRSRGRGRGRGGARSGSQAQTAVVPSIGTGGQVGTAVPPVGSSLDDSFNPDQILGNLPSATLGSKRPTSFDLAGETPSKRQKLTHTNGPCKDFADGLAKWAAEQGEPVDTPMKTVGTNEMDTIYRAIATVTQAVALSTAGDRQFCLIAAADAAESDEQAKGPSRTFERPGQQALIPWFKKESDGSPITHVSLYIIERSPPSGDREGDDAFKKGVGSETPFAPEPRIDRIVDKLLQRLGWPDRSAVKTSVFERYPSIKNTWDTAPDAGHLAVIYAWMYVLGLPLENYDIPAGSRHDEFHVRSVQVINLALQGNMDSKTIEAFLKCHGLVKQDHDIPSNRHFNNTVEFSQSLTLPLLLARTRLRRQLETEPRGSGPSYNDVEDTLRDAGRLHDILEMDLGELLEVYTSLTMPASHGLPSAPQRDSSKLAENESGDTNEEQSRGEAGESPLLEPDNSSSSPQDTLYDRP